MMKLTVISTLGMFLVAACGSTDTVKSGDVNETQYFRSYSLNYDATAQELAHTAQFRVGGITGTTIELTEPSKVSLAGKDQSFTKITSSVLTGTFYSLAIKTATPDAKETFVWTRKDSTTTQDELSLPTAVSATTPEGQIISKSAGYDVTLTEDAVSADDSVSVTITSDAASAAEGQSRMVLETTSSGMVVHFTSDDLSKMVLGSAKLVVKHTKNVRVDSTSKDLGGYMTSSYTTSAIAVIIAP